MQHFDLIHIEGIAIVAAEVAHAVEEDVVARGEATDGEAVSLRAAFAGGQADAGNVAQGVAQCGCALVLNDLLRDDINGLRSFHQRLACTWAECLATRCLLLQPQLTDPGLAG